MKKQKISFVLLKFVLTIALTVLFSFILSNYVLKPEKATIQVPKSVMLDSSMTVGQISKQNHLKISSVEKALGLNAAVDQNKTLNELSISQEDANQKIIKQLNFEVEEATKNFKLILLKFMVWFIFIVYIFRLVRRGKIQATNRKYLLLASFVIFGVLLGAEPNPMGTIKDAIALFAIKDIIFPPRIVAFLVFLAVTIFANKFICGWACQFGTLQDFIFRLNRTKENRPILPQYKIPFRVTNTVRISFFTVFTIAAFLWSMDIIGVINPFTIFHPSSLTLLGTAFLSVILLLSLFIYRPWCHLFCPFGLAGWFVERFSVYKIKVNESTCTSCGSCIKACPTFAMKGTMNQDKNKPDCFSCATCIEACPTKSISFEKGKKDHSKTNKTTVTTTEL